MSSLKELFEEYKKQLQIGHIQKAYQGILDFMTSLRLHLEKSNSNVSLSSSIQNYYLEVSYFFIVTEMLKKEKLKIVLFFYHNSFTFDVWLSGNNKAVRKKFTEKLSPKSLSKFKSSITVNDEFSIVRHTLVDNADFSDSKALVKKIEKGILLFIDNTEKLLTKII